MVAPYLENGLSRGEGVVAIAGAAQIDALAGALGPRVIQEAEREGRFHAVDAADLLGRFMHAEWPRGPRFLSAVGAVLDAAGQGRPVRVGCGLAAALVGSGHRDAALEVERLWNDLLARRTASVLCVHSLAGFSRDVDRHIFRSLCVQHQDVRPATAPPADALVLHRHLATLEQAAHALKAESAERRRLEDELAQARRDAERVHAVIEAGRAEVTQHLTAVEANADLLLDGPPLSYGQRAAVERIFRSARRAAALQAPAARDGRLSMEPPRTVSVLVVDDESAVRHFTVERLRRLGHRVLEAADASAALAVARDEPGVDALVMDLSLPGGSGVEVARAVSERHPRVVVLFTSGEMPSAGAPALADVRTDFLAKPFSPERLAAALDGLLDPTPR